MPLPPSSTVLDPGKPAVAKTADDINDLFKDLDVDETPEVKVKTEKEPPTEKEEEDLDLVEPDDDIEKLDLAKADDDIDIDAPPRKKEILKEYPELFKKFPFLEKILYRDRQYSELFGSFDDAKEASERVEAFDAYESQLLGGDTEQVLREVKEADENAFNKMVDDYLRTLAKVDKDAYFHVVGNLNRRLIMEMVQEANDTGNDDLKQAALLVNQFVFGTSKFTAPQNRTVKEEDSGKKEVEQERLSFVRERFESSRDELQSRVDNTLRATISEYIDPRGNMSPYVKKNAVADAMKNLGELISSDGSVVKNLDRLWKVAFEDKFSKDSLGRIQSYYLSRAKGNLKQAILKARAEALKDSRPESRTKETDEVEEETPRTRKPIPSGKPSNKTGKNSMQKGESVTDFFMRD